MPIRLYTSEEDEDKNRPSATIHVVQNRHQLVIDTYLRDFGDAVDEVGNLIRLASSDKPKHKRYFIKVNREMTLEKAAEIILKRLSEIAHEMINMSDTWDIWK